MKKIHILLLFLFFFLSGLNLHAGSIKIAIKVDNEIITNIDIENEIKYLKFLNPKLKNLNEIRIKNISKNSLIKKNELEKIYDFKNEEDFFNSVEKRFLENKNIESNAELIQILKSKDLDYMVFKKKILVEALWNQLIFNKYSNNVKINKNYLKQNLIEQFKNQNKKYEYNLSEIFFSDLIDENVDKTFEKLYTSIKEIGFENTANIFSISSTSKNGGLIGWVNELQISKSVRKNISKLKKDEIGKPIKIGNGYLLIKLNNKREFKQEINIENELRGLVNKETSRQLNTFSVIFYKKLKKNIQIDEF